MKASKKASARLDRRQKDWDDIKASDISNRGKVKMIGRMAYRRPGSVKGRS